MMYNVNKVNVNKNAVCVWLAVCFSAVRSVGVEQSLSRRGDAAWAQLQTDPEWLHDPENTEPEQVLGSGVCTGSGEMQVRG